MRNIRQECSHILYEIPWSTSGILDQGLKYMNEIPKYNEWNHNTRPAGECIMVSWVVFWDFMNVFENLVLKPRVGHGIFDLHNNCNPNTLCGEWYLDNVLWKLTSGIWKLYYENSLCGEWYLENVLWKLTSEIWKLYYENSLCGEWDMNHISLSTHRVRYEPYLTLWTVGYEPYLTLWT